MPTNPLLADPNENPFRKPPIRPMELATDRPPAPAPGSYGSPGFNNARAWMGDQGFAVGKAAQQYRPDATAVRWREVLGVRAKDPDFKRRQRLFYGHAATPEEEQEKAEMIARVRANPTYAAGAGGAGAGGAPGGGPPRNFEGELQSFISDVLGGKQGPYTPEAVSNLKAGAFDEFAGGLTAQNRAAANRARRTGNLYSASTGSELAENERSAREGLGKQFRDVDNTATQANFSARMGALTQGLQKLQSDRDLAIANARDATDRQRIAQEYDAAIKTTQMKISSEEKLAQAANQAAGAAAGRGRSWDLEDEMRRRQWQLEDRAYEENWRLYDAGLSADAGF